MVLKPDLRRKQREAKETLLSVTIKKTFPAIPEVEKEEKKGVASIVK